MKLIIKKLVILSKKENAGKTIIFDDDFNAIIGVNKSGKSCIAKSILYCLGCDVVFEQEWKDLENTYLLFFTYNDKDYVLKRENLTNSIRLGANVFFLKNLKTNETYRFNKTKELSDFFNLLFDFKIKLPLREKENEYSFIYPNHMFLLNYVDQDTSWGNLLSDTFDRLNFLIDYKVAILDYFLGYRNNDYYDLYFKKIDLNTKMAELRKNINVLYELKNDNQINLKYIEDIDVAKFEKTFNQLTASYDNVLKEETDYKNKLGALISKLSYFEKMKSQIELATEDLIKQTESVECPLCHSDTYNTIEENYLITDSIWNLKKEKERYDINIDELNNEIKEQKLQLVKITDLCKQIEDKLQDKKSKMEFLEKATDFGLYKVIEEIDKKLTIKNEEIYKLNESLKTIINELKAIEKDDSIKENFVKTMKSVFKELGLTYIFKQDVSPFLSFRTNYSGTERIESFIGFYLTINKLISSRDDFTIFPFIFDTLYKDDFDPQNIIKVIKVYLKETKETNQQKILFTTNNDSVIEELKANNINIINLTDKKKLLTENFDSIYKEYENYININRKDD